MKKPDIYDRFSNAVKELSNQYQSVRTENVAAAQIIAASIMVLK
jgi:hypothetical protein